MELNFKNNPSAFPHFKVDEDGKIFVDTVMTGMTLLDYHSAHAPKVPKWFKPKIADEPKHPGYLADVFGAQSNHKHKDVFVKYYNDVDGGWANENEIPEEDYSIVQKDLKYEVHQHIFKVDEYVENHNQWEFDKKIQSIIQWRFFYANQMLKYSVYQTV